MQQTAVSATPFDLVGGRDVVGQIVERFYDLLEQDPAYAELRALHAPDLAPMRKSLTGFLAAWLGGPRDWFDEHPGLCMMSAHRGVAMTPQVGRQWANAMSRAITESPVEPVLAAKMAEALSDLAIRMAA
ncbi:MAG: group II truncated hemoglobin [Novosphingobium sp.]|nr:group II truncated hemoglobin [Novosphingobium sp.]